MVARGDVLQIEGEKYGINVNTLSPTAVTRMTEELFSGAAKELLTPETISPGVLFLASKDGPKRTILCAGGGCFAVATVPAYSTVRISKAAGVR